ncbi:hypothetical protein [uncultured Pontibacter sp.]|uniref:hypothetical protein n=1 Tax=uncultured Pontibacter sp. TaxID=453356 RepID=UPI0026342D04|nr:hypothetical protein [uncultured Pontibacter sp.]
MEIRKWLDSDRDYEQGRLLFEKHSLNQALKNLFALGPGVYNSRKLEEELEKLQEPEPPKAVAPGAAPAKPEHRDVSLQVWEQLVPLLDEQRALHTALSLLPTNAARLKHAVRIMELADRLAPLWDTYHYAKEHGRLPEVEVQHPVPKKEADQLRRLNNLRTYRSRYRDRPDKLAEIEPEIKLLEEALKNVNPEV